ncbi:hypothetical protein B0J14DRAFT_687706 [Halenospora varia]|nr:hypothetical protein B0J14DRAFT_687706 [Halenospora varia]
MTTPITRVTMIKIPADKIEIALQGFETFTKTQQKDGKPYILSMEAGPAQGNVRDQGYTFVTKSVFVNMEDMKFYETQCAGHQEYKVFLREKAPVEGLMTVYFQADVSYIS